MATTVDELAAQSITKERDSAADQQSSQFPVRASDPRDPSPPSASAHTPSQAPNAAGVPDESKPPVSHRGLRKSSSADSIIKQSRAEQLHADEGEQQPKHTVGDRNQPTDRQSLSSPSSSLSLSGYFRSKVRSRRRGTSHSATDNDASTQDESDFDKVKSTGKRVRQRLLSFKSSKSTTSGEHVPLPSPFRGTSASLTNLRSHDLSAPGKQPKSPNALSSTAPNSFERARARSSSVGAPPSGFSRYANIDSMKRRSVVSNMALC